MKTEENDIEQQLLAGERRTVPPRAESRPVPPPSASEDEIDLADLIRQVWARRRVVWITTLVMFLLGVLVAVVSPEEYEASVVLMPQSSETGSGIGAGLLRQFGGLGGLGLGSAGGNGTLTPALYPEITQSTPFFLEMMEEEVYFATMDTTLTYTQYFGEMDPPGVLDYLKTYTVGLPRLIINLPVKLINAFRDKPAPAVVLETTATPSDTPDASSEPLRLTGQQRSIIAKIQDRITTTVEENSTVKIEAEMPDPMVAARATEMATAYLTNYILEYRTEKAQQDLEFIQQQYNEKKTRYDASQRQLARFRDRNMNIISETALIEQQQLEAENQLAFSLYQGMAEQLEQAKVKVQEETPVFKVLEPVQVPLSTSAPNRELIIFLSLFVGVFMGLGIVFGLILYNNIKHTLTTT